MKDDNRQNTLLLTVIAIATLMVAIIGATFAYFTANASGGETASTIQVSGGSLTIDYADRTAALSYTQVNNQVEPQSAAVIKKAFTLTGKNTTELKMPYTILLKIQNNEFSDGALTYKLTNQAVSASDGSITLVNSGEGSIPGAELTLVGEDGATYESYTKGAAVQNQAMTLANGQFLTSTAGVQHSYTLEVFFLDNNKVQDYDKNARFAAYIDVTAQQAAK